MPPPPIALGLDLGSTTTKLLAIDENKRPIWHRIEPTEPRMDLQADRLIDEAANALGAESLPLVATGYGRKLVSRADLEITEISCHARGAFASCGHGGTLVDVGGQDSKMVEILGNGKVGRFAMNDKCAAGTGRFLEVVGARLELEPEEFSRLALSTDEEEPISSTCTVFAESELISLLARGRPLAAIVRGLVRSLVKRVAALARGSGARAPLMLSGGVALGAAYRDFIAEELGMPVELPESPQLIGALGAAILARERLGGRRDRSP